MRGGDTGIDETLIDKIVAVPGVKYATPVIERTLDLTGGQGEVLAILAVNFTEDPRALDHLYQLDAAALKKPAAPEKATAVTPARPANSLLLPAATTSSPSAVR